MLLPCGLGLTGSGIFHAAIEDDACLGEIKGNRGGCVKTSIRVAAAYALSGRISDAVVRLRAAITLSPANPDLHAQLSQALASTGQLEPAIAERTTALHLRADDADDWNNLGVLEARANHLHLLITVSGDSTVERVMQFIKGGFSYRLKRELEYLGEVWQRGFSEVRVDNRESYVCHQEYIAQNPVRKGLVDSPEKFPYCFTYLAERKRAGAKAQS